MRRPRTVVVSANLEGLVSAHEEANLSCFFVLQEFNLSNTSLFPFTTALFVLSKTEKLGAAEIVGGKNRIGLEGYRG